MVNSDHQFRELINANISASVQPTLPFTSVDSTLRNIQVDAATTSTTADSVGITNETASLMPNVESDEDKKSNVLLPGLNNGGKVSTIKAMKNHRSGTVSQRP